MQLMNLKQASKLLTAGLVLSVSLGLTACGYQLRGTTSDYSLPVSVHIYADNEHLLATTVKALRSADVDTSEAKFATELTTDMADTAAIRLVNTQTNKEAVIYDNSGNETHWRYSLSTEVIVGQGDNAKTYNLSEQQQVDLSGSSSTANDRIVKAAWEDLYQRLAQRVLGVIGS